MEKRDVARVNSPNRRQDDGLGANSDIGRKLRALYGAIEQEEIPATMLDLLDKLDQAELSAAGPGAVRKGSGR